MVTRSSTSVSFWLSRATVRRKLGNHSRDRHRRGPLAGGCVYVWQEIGQKPTNSAGCRELPARPLAPGLAKTPCRHRHLQAPAPAGGWPHRVPPTTDSTTSSAAIPAALSASVSRADGRRFVAAPRSTAPGASRRHQEGLRRACPNPLILSCFSWRQRRRWRSSSSAAACSPSAGRS